MKATLAHGWRHLRCFPPLARDAFAAWKDASFAEDAQRIEHLPVHEQPVAVALLCGSSSSGWLGKGCKGWSSKRVVKTSAMCSLLIQICSCGQYLIVHLA